MEVLLSHHKHRGVVGAESGRVVQGHPGHVGHTFEQVWIVVMDLKIYTSLRHGVIQGSTELKEGTDYTRLLSSLS